MPLIAAFFARQLVVLAVQGGIFLLASRILVPMLNTILAKIAKVFGVDEEDAKDILSNEIIELAEALGIAVAFSRARLPLALAERLGFTSKGFAKRTLSPKAQTATRGKTGQGLPPSTTQSQAILAMAQAMQSQRGGLLSKASQVASLIIAGFGVPVGLGFIITNSIDFAAWPTSRYNSTFVRLFAKIGLKPDEPVTKSKLLSAEVFTKVFNAYDADGVLAINNPFKEVIEPYTRQSLVDLVDQLFAGELIEQGSLKSREIFGALTALMLYSENAPLVIPRKPIQPQVLIAKPVFAPTPRALRGTLAQGTLAEPSAPIAILEEEITNVEELAAKAKSVLMQFLQSIPGRVTYNIKLVTSYVDESGIRRYAKAQTQQDGFNADGTPKMKTRLNRIAVVDIGFVKRGGVPVKVDQLVFGPTDAFKLTTGITQLAAVEEEVRDTLPGIPAVAPVLAIAPPPPVLASVFTPAPKPVFVPTPLPAYGESIYRKPGITDADLTLDTFEAYDGIYRTLPDGTAELLQGPFSRPRFLPRPTGPEPVFVPTPTPTPAPAPVPPPPFTPIEQIPYPKLAPSVAMPRIVTVNVPLLFVRAEPSASAPLAGTQRLVFGNTFLATGAYLGENVAGESRWWRSIFGNWVWVGGTAEKP
jgi:hypothetical protein